MDWELSDSKDNHVMLSIRYPSREGKSTIDMSDILLILEGMKYLRVDRFRYSRTGNDFDYAFISGDSVNVLSWYPLNKLVYIWIAEYNEDLCSTITDTGISQGLHRRLVSKFIQIITNIE